VTYIDSKKRFVVVGYNNASGDGVALTSDWLEAGAGIVEQGTNTNGDYVIFSNGLQMCWGTRTESLPINTSNGSAGGFKGDMAAQTFPVAYDIAPVVQSNTENAVSVGIRLISATSFVNRLINISSVGSASRTVGWVAIGQRA
jgi:hypothetical protein